ncbi:MAG: tRNA lysidine(34) synthetase TilS [Gammaproteobacteria bacterium]|nr:tRNA lysidine(34) synthetase TilS [Gammaproteobacteria bacterium]
MQVSTESIAAFLDTLPGRKRFLIAYSGGLDSHVLLHLMVCLREESGYGIRAAHVNHNIQRESRDWAGHCRDTCRALGVEMAVIDVDAGRAGKESPESRARRKRYAALEGILAEGEVLLTAHHRDDQVETLLLRLFRGSGVMGLASMRAVRPFAKGLHARPLLQHTREQLSAYAGNNGLDWIEDPSNADTRLDRNFVRHEVLPVIKNRWPSVDLPVTRTIRIFSETQELLDDVARQDLQVCSTQKPDVLAVDLLKRLSIPRQKNLVRYWCRTLNLPGPDSRSVSRIVAEAIAARHDSNAQVSWSGAELHRYGNYVQLIVPPGGFDKSSIRVWDFKAPCRLDFGELTAVEGNGSGLKKELCNGARVEVRYRNGGEKIRLPGRTCRHKLKKLFQETATPPWLRERVPLIYVGDRLAMAAGFWTDAHFVAGAGEPSWIINWSYTSNV